MLAAPFEIAKFGLGFIGEGSKTLFLRATSSSFSEIFIFSEISKGFFFRMGPNPRKTLYFPKFPKCFWNVLREEIRHIFTCIFLFNFRKLDIF